MEKESFNEQQNEEVAAGPRVTATFVRLTEPIRTIELPGDTKLECFLKKLEVPFDESIRVNKKNVTPDYVVQEGDIITQLDKVKGGADEPEAVVEPRGAFIDSLKRNNRQIRDDRATAIGETAQIKYRRAVEDIEVNLKQMRRDRENMMDLSPENALSLKLASDFDADEFVNKDIELGVKIRNAEIKLEIAKKQYEYLFGTM